MRSGRQYVDAMEPGPPGSRALRSSWSALPLVGKPAGAANLSSSLSLKSVSAYELLSVSPRSAARPGPVA